MCWRLGLAALVTCASASCAGIVGITDVPEGSGSSSSSGPDGGGTTVIGPDGSIIITPRPDGSTTSSPDTGTVTSGGDSSSGGGTALPYAASNINGMTFDASMTTALHIQMSDTCTIYTESPGAPEFSCTGDENPSMDFFPVTQSNGTTAVIYVFQSLIIDHQALLQVEGPNPLIIVALGTVEIHGTIDVSADAYDNDDSPIPGELSTGPGVGHFATDQSEGGGGGSFCGTGGQGAINPEDGANAASMAAGGQPYGNPNLVPLQGGSAGGGATTQNEGDTANGLGGGAIQISAAGPITIESDGIINANGSGGIASINGEGAGSGGAILLEAPSVTVMVGGVLEANGGEGADPGFDGAVPPSDGSVATSAASAGGNGSAGASINGAPGTTSSSSANLGGGGGAAGRIRINATTTSLSGTLSPAMGTACMTVGSTP